MKLQFLKRVNTLKNCLPMKRAIWILLLDWLLLQKLLHSWERSAKSKTALNKRRFEIEETTRKGGFFMIRRFLNLKNFYRKRVWQLNMVFGKLGILLNCFAIQLLIAKNS